MKRKIISIVLSCLLLALFPLLAILYMSNSKDTCNLIKDYSNYLMDYWIDIDIEKPLAVNVSTEISNLFLNKDLLTKYLSWFSINEDYTPVTESYIMQDTYDITGEIIEGDDFIALPFITPGSGERIYKVLVLDRKGRIIELKESLW